MAWSDPEKRRAYFRARYLANRERAIEQAKAWAKANPERRAATYKEWAEQNREVVRENVARFYRENPDKSAAKTAAYRASKMQRVPPWFGELDELAVQEATHLAVLRKRVTGVDWHVDHVVPLRGKRVSGLHIAANLQVIPAVENLRKSNKLLTQQELRT